jgi:hypothetical protein
MDSYSFAFNILPSIILPPQSVSQFAADSIFQPFNSESAC